MSFGLQMHSHAFTDVSVARGRSVAVVGSNQAALDCTSKLVLSQAPKSVVMICKTVSATHRALHVLLAHSELRQHLPMHKLRPACIEPAGTLSCLRSHTGWSLRTAEPGGSC